MKKLSITALMVMVMFIGLCGVSFAGLVLESTSSCNDWYFSFTESEGVYSIYGYEYGCGTFGAEASGAIEVGGGYAWIGVTGSNNSEFGENGQLFMRNYVVDLSTWSGAYLFNYVYTTSGAIDGHSGSGTVDMWLGGPQAQSILEGDEINEAVK